MTVWGASIEIVLLLLVMLVAVIYAWVIEDRRMRRMGRLLRWVQSTYPDVWSAQHWTLRKVNRWGGLCYIHREGLIDDPHFNAEMRAVRPDLKRLTPLFLVATAVLVLILVGVRYWGWQW